MLSSDSNGEMRAKVKLWMYLQEDILLWQDFKEALMQGIP